MYANAEFGAVQKLESEVKASKKGWKRHEENHDEKLVRKLEAQREDVCKSPRSRKILRKKPCLVAKSVFDTAENGHRQVRYLIKAREP